MVRERDSESRATVVERAKLHIHDRERVTIATTDSIERHSVSDRLPLPKNIRDICDKRLSEVSFLQLRNPEQEDIEVILDLCREEVRKEPIVFESFSNTQRKPDLRDLLAMSARIMSNNCGAHTVKTVYGEGLGYYLTRDSETNQYPNINCGVYNAGFMQVFETLAQRYNPGIGETHRLITVGGRVGLDIRFQTLNDLPIDQISERNYGIVHAYPILLSYGNTSGERQLLTTTLDPYWTQENSFEMTPSTASGLVNTYRWNDTVLALKDRFQFGVLSDDKALDFPSPSERRRLKRIDIISLLESDISAVGNLEHALIFHNAMIEMLEHKSSFETRELRGDFKNAVRHYSHMRDALIIQYARRIESNPNRISSYDLLLLYSMEKMMAAYGYPPQDKRVYQSLHKALDIIEGAQLDTADETFSIIYSRVSSDDIQDNFSAEELPGWLTEKYGMTAVLGDTVDNVKKRRQIAKENSELFNKRVREIWNANYTGKVVKRQKSESRGKRIARKVIGLLGR